MEAMASQNASGAVAMAVAARDEDESASGKNALMSLLNPLLVQLRVPREIPAQYESKWRHTDVWKCSVRSDTSDVEEEDEDSHTSDSSNTALYVVRSQKRQKAASEPSQKPKKSRKPTYAVRKEEKEALLKELRVLEARAELLRERVGMPSLEERLTLEKARMKNKELVDARRTHLLSLQGMHSVLSRNLRDHLESPMVMKVRLGVDMGQRRETLLAMRDERLRVGVQYLAERFRGVDVGKPFEETTSWTSYEGDFWFQQGDVTLFEGVRSVKQVYDALIFYMMNMEISISEKLGQLTLREDIDCIDSKVSNHRIISSTDHGVVMEMNSAAFSEYFESHPDEDGNELAIITCDPVEADELYPYCPEERVRKTLTASFSVNLVRRPPAPKLRGVITANESRDFVVVMRRCAYLCIRKPQFEISAAALADIKANVVIWSEVLTKTVRETVYSNTLVVPPPIVSSDRLHDPASEARWI